MAGHTRVINPFDRNSHQYSQGICERTGIPFHTDLLTSDSKQISQALFSAD